MKNLAGLLLAGVSTGDLQYLSVSKLVKGV